MKLIESKEGKVRISLEKAGKGIYRIRLGDMAFMATGKLKIALKKYHELEEKIFPEK